MGNTFSVSQEDDQEPILKEEELHPITKIDKEEKKGREKREIGKIPKRKKRKQNGTQTRITKNHTNDRTQTKKRRYLHEHI